MQKSTASIICVVVGKLAPPEVLSFYDYKSAFISNTAVFCVLFIIITISVSGSDSCYMSAVPGYVDAWTDALHF